MATPIPKNRAVVTTWFAAAATAGKVLRVAGEGARAVGITSDSRAVVPGSAFVALKGETHDGHAFLGDAKARGAALFVVENGRGAELSGSDVVEVSDTLDAWGALARAHVRGWRANRAPTEPARVVAITGSAGKTTTKELCASILRAIGDCHATAGNLNNRIGVPAVLFALERRHRFAVVEVGMSVPDEIARLAAIVEPDVAVVTNVGVAHAEGVGGSRAHVAREKGALYAALPEGGTAIVNADDPAASGEVARTIARRVVTFGKAEHARYRLLERTSLGAEGSRFTLRRPRDPNAWPGESEDIEVALAIVGEVAAIDFLAALGAAEAAYGASIPHRTILSALESHATVAGRTAVHRLKDGTLLIDDTYNANPSSMRASLHAAAELGRADGRRVVAVLGEMKELGPFAAAEHEAIGDVIAETRVGVAIGCGGLIGLALDRAARAGVTVVKATDVAGALREAESRVVAGDVVLVKGSRSVGAERVVDAFLRARGEEGAG